MEGDRSYRQGSLQHPLCPARQTPAQQTGTLHASAKSASNNAQTKQLRSSHMTRVFPCSRVKNRTVLTCPEREVLER